MELSNRIVGRPAAPAAASRSANGGSPANSRYSHILVPVSLMAQDRAALLLAVEMAAVHGAKLTILHVIPSLDSDPSLHWLDAIGSLHVALNRGSDPLSRDRIAATAERVRSRVRKFIEGTVPESMSEGVNLNIECRSGELAETIARFADVASVDLLILSSGLSRWWLPLLPAYVRRVLKLTRKPVILATEDVAEREVAVP